MPLLCFCLFVVLNADWLNLHNYNISLYPGFQRAHFLLLPWLILTSMLTPLFVIGIVAGCKMIGQ